MYVRLEVNVSSLKDYNRKKINIVSRWWSLFIYAIMVVTVICCQLLYYYAELIPEEADEYDGIMKDKGFDPFKCKYGPNNSVIADFSW